MAHGPKDTVVQRRKLEPETAQQLIQASKPLGWSCLTSLLNKLANATLSGVGGLHMFQMLQVFEALDMLLGKVALGTLQSSTCWSASGCVLEDLSSLAQL